MISDLALPPTTTPGRLLRTLLAPLAPLVAQLPAAARPLTAAHAAMFVRTDGRLAGRWFGMPVLVLETVGRRSGRCWATPLVYLRDGDDLVVVAANAGAPRHPQWWLNLRAAGHAVAVTADRRQRVLVREPSGAERHQLWRRLAAVLPIDEYQRRTTRPLPVVVLTPQLQVPGRGDNS